MTLAKVERALLAAVIEVIFWLLLATSTMLAKVEKTLAENIDKASLVLFPLSYAIYVAVVFTH